VEHAGLTEELHRLPQPAAHAQDARHAGPHVPRQRRLAARFRPGERPRDSRLGLLVTAEPGQALRFHPEQGDSQARRRALEVRGRNAAQQFEPLAVPLGVLTLGSQLECRAEPCFHAQAGRPRREGRFQAAADPLEVLGVPERTAGSCEQHQA